MRLALPDDQWADLRDRLLYKQARDVRAALIAGQVDPVAKADAGMAYVRAYVTAWYVVGLDGEPVPLEEPELAPDDMIQAITLAALNLWQGQPAVPKAGAARSRTTPRALRSA